MEEKKLEQNLNPRESMRTNYHILGRGNWFFLPFICVCVREDENNVVCKCLCLCLRLCL
jgi:hypothetical protein